MFRSKVLREIEGWQGRGLIDADVASRLSDDVRSRFKAFSFASVLGLLAAILLGAAVLTFVAANWEQVPRLGRVGAIGAIIAAGPLLGAWLEARGHGLVGEGARLVGSAGFGAGIALVGQMYHLSGDETAAVLVWCSGTGFAALLTRSKALTIGAIVLAATYLAMATGLLWAVPGFPWWYPGLLAALWALALWTDSVGARRLLVLALIHYGFHLWIDSDLAIVPMAMIALSAALLAAAAWRPEATDRALRLGGAAGFLGLVGFTASLFLLHWMFSEEPVSFVIVALIGLVGAVAALWTLGADDRAVRVGAYVLFAIEVVLVYFITVGGLIGTAAFFLSAGVVLALAAFIILRLERRMAARRSEGGA